MLQAQVTQPLTGSTGPQHPPGGESGEHQPLRCLIGGGQTRLVFLGLRSEPEDDLNFD